MNEITDAAAIRKRPGMYIGDTREGSGLAHMVWEVVSNSVDEHLAGHCSLISVEIEENGAIAVEDDGRGFPIHDVNGMPLAERALTTFHTTPTLDGHAPHTHVGLHGVGIFVVCALSTSLELRVQRDGRRWVQRFAQGHAVSRLEDSGACEATGTRLTFLPDLTIFKGRPLDSTIVLERLTELSFLLPKLTLRFVDRRQHTLHQPGGLAGHLTDTARDAAIGATFSLTDTVDDVLVEVAARWSPQSSMTVRSFANTERTTSGGTHVQGLLAGLSEGLKRAAPELCRSSSSKARVRAVTQELSALVCVRLDDPTYDSPTKSLLSTPRVQGIVKATVARAFARFLAEQPTLASHFAASLQQ